MYCMNMFHPTESVFLTRDGSVAWAHNASVAASNPQFVSELILYDCLFNMPELKLVYRGLRQISDWSLRFYSNVYVDGQANVPKDGPLIMCVCPLPNLIPPSTPARRPRVTWYER